ncbi:hypothetical protein CCHR01_07670 [Colletotrichum chrysophilum]|uniref:Secreted protein n=1 Tax=Colletotrichum chrysophilum TaxID=1836956 RepID=A0AAD9EM94_9PEZI|nr:hypothetical protein CCHR01_07670 [Colletotrichum chrysophilum]
MCRKYIYKFFPLALMTIRSAWLADGEARGDLKKRGRHGRKSNSPKVMYEPVAAHSPSHLYILRSGFVIANSYQQSHTIHW